MPPLPSPGNVIRVTIEWGPSDTNTWGSRFFVSYTGGPPTTADLNSFCTAVFNAYASDLMTRAGSTIFLQAVYCLDLSSDTGNEGSHSGSVAGSLSGAALPEDACCLVNFTIPRHYRGGKPKIFLPPATASELANDTDWSSTQVTDVNAGWTSFMTTVTGETYSSFSAAAHVNISYYSGFTNHLDSTGRYKVIPTKRATPLVDLVSAHNLRGLIGSQRRRRTSMSA